jgi:hypothetical protein
MKNAIVGLSVIAVFLLGFIAPTFAAEQKGDYSPEMQAKIEEVKKELKKFTTGNSFRQQARNSPSRCAP